MEEAGQRANQGPEECRLGQSWAGLSWVGLGWAGQGRAGQGRAGQGRAGQGRAEKECSSMEYRKFFATLFFSVWHPLLVRNCQYPFRKHFLQIREGYVRSKMERSQDVKICLFSCTERSYYRFLAI